MRPSIVKAKLRNHQPVVGVSLHLTDPSLFELTSLYGFDFIWYDLEHHAASLQTVGQMIRASRIGRTDVMCRPAKGEFMRMGRMLELGAHGIMYPRCDDAAEAREVVRWAKFGPQGTRGFDGSGADNPYCATDFAEYIRAQNEAAAGYKKEAEWTKRSILNTARMGKFSSDRTIQQYADEIWGVKPVGRKAG